MGFFIMAKGTLRFQEKKNLPGCHVIEIEIAWLMTLSPLFFSPFGCFQKSGNTPKWMVFFRKTLLKWMIWGYHYFRKHPFPSIHFKSVLFFQVPRQYITVESLDLRKIRLEKTEKHMIPNAGEKWWSTLVHSVAKKKQLKQIQVEGLQPILRSFLRSRSY